MSPSASNSIKSTSTSGNLDKKGGNSGNKKEGGSSGSGSDDSNDDYDDYVLKKFKESKPLKMRHLKENWRTFQRVGKSKFWLSRDRAGHGGSHFKLYIKKGTTLDFVGSVPMTIFKSEIYKNREQLDDIFKSGTDLDRHGLDFDIISKAESRSGDQVKWDDLTRVN